MAMEISSDVTSKILKVYKLLEPYLILVEPLFSSVKQLMYAEILVSLGCSFSNYGLGAVYLRCGSIKIWLYPFTYGWIEKVQQGANVAQLLGTPFNVNIVRREKEYVREAVGIQVFARTELLSFSIDDTLVEPGSVDIEKEGVRFIGFATIRGTPEEYKPFFEAYVKVEGNEVASFNYSWSFYENPPIPYTNLPKPGDRPIRIFNKFWQLYGNDIVEAVIKMKPYLNELERSLSLLILY
jgi:hypothetical protein